MVELQPDKAKLRWFQFRLRTLLLLMFVIVLGLVAWRTFVEPYRRQAAAMVVIKHLNGRYQSTAPPQWQRRIYRGDYQRITLVDLRDCDEPDEYIGAIEGMPYLETLVVGGELFTDDHLRRLRRIKSLRNLVLDTTGVSDGAVKELHESGSSLQIYQSQRRALGRFASAQSMGCRLQTRFSNRHSDLRRHLGDELFLESVAVERVKDADMKWARNLRTLQQLSADQLYFADAGLTHVAPLQSLQSISLRGTRISDDGIIPLAMLGNLRNLDLCNTQITGAGLRHVATLLDLRELWLSHTPTTDAGLRHLAALTQLRSLCLSHTLVTDWGLAQLRALPCLEEVFLDGTLVTDAGLEVLKECKQLKVLVLNNTEVSDTGLKHLSRLTTLTKLSLDDTRVSDAGLTSLEGLTELRWLWLRRTSVTQYSVAKLREFLPQCLIANK
jgi:hypothetical protein